MRFNPLKLPFLILFLPGLTFAQELALDFSAAEIGGNGLIQLSDYRGRVVFLDFWASWCPPCLLSLPAYDKMYREIDDPRFEIIAVNVDENTENGLEFLEDHPVSYPVMADPEGAIGKPYGIRSLPVSYLIGPAGRIVRKYRDYKAGDEIELKQEILNLLKEL